MTDSNVLKPRYRADITAGALKLRESQLIAELLMQGLTEEDVRSKVIESNLLQARNPRTTKRLLNLVLGRLLPMSAELWKMIRDGNGIIASQALLVASVKHSMLLGDFLDLVVREQYRIFSPLLSRQLWDDYLIDCRGRDPEMPEWNESTKIRLRSSVYQILAQSGFIESTKSLKLQHVHIAPQILQYLKGCDEHYVLRCIQMGRHAYE